MKSIVYNQDCLEAMKQMPDKAFDLAIVDPPFNLSVGSKCWYGSDISNTGIRRTTTEKFKEWDSKTITNEYFVELKRISRNQIIWGANHFIEVMPVNSSCWIVWDKENQSSTFADCELAWTSFKTSVRIFRYMWNGMLQGNMKNKEKRFHPTQKPIALYRWLLTNYGKSGQSVFDSHLGSGSSRIAAYDLGFDFTGYELDKDYFEAQERRFADHIAQARLFDAPVLETVEQDKLF